jgi:hypothetical protein
LNWQQIHRIDRNEERCSKIEDPYPFICDYSNERVGESAEEFYLKKSLENYKQDSNERELPSLHSYKTHLYKTIFMRI